MLKQGQIFRLTSRDADGAALWAYRYRTGGRESERVQRGGFASEGDARAGALASAREAATSQRHRASTDTR